jgi:hypothetical protein
MKALIPVLVSAATLLAAAPALSHHSFAAVFDINRPVEFTGTVTKLEWTNPHAWIYIDAEGANGEMQNWSIELLGINTLLKQGWRPGILKPGDVVQVKGFAARDGSPKANASVFTMVETGQELWVSQTGRE